MTGQPQAITAIASPGQGGAPPVAPALRPYGPAGTTAGTAGGKATGAGRGLHARRAKTGRSVVALMLREMSSTYGRSPGGYVWGLLEPVGAIAMFTLIIALGLRIRAPSIGVSFELFFATGVLPYMLFLRASRNVAAAIPFSRALLFYPAVTFTDAIIARFLLQVLIHCMVFCIVMTGVLMIFETRAIVQAGPILASLAMAAALGLGVGVLNAFLFPAYPLWQSVWGILTTPLFIMSTVVYSYEHLPQVGQQILWYNPLVHVVGMMRRGFYGTYDAVWVSPVYVFGLAAVLTLIGFVLLGRYHRFITNREFD